MTAGDLLDVLWRDYVASTPKAAHIHHLLTEHGAVLRHDHVTITTFGAPGVGGDAIAALFAARGWAARAAHDGAALRVRGWRHDDPALPQLVVRELIVDALAPSAQAIVAGLIAQLPDGDAARGAALADAVLAARRPWQLDHADYLVLARESACAARVAAFGPRVHDFAVDIDSLAAFPDLAAVNAFLCDHGVELDEEPAPPSEPAPRRRRRHSSGHGAIRGSRAERLELTTTRPDLASVAFRDATVRIASGCYGFARRYASPSGEPFDGLLAALAPRGLDAGTAF